MNKDRIVASSIMGSVLGIGFTTVQLLNHVGVLHSLCFGLVGAVGGFLGVSIVFMGDSKIK